MKHKTLLLHAALVAATLSLGVVMPLAWAQSVASKPQVLTEGEIRKVDKDAQKLTIRHGPILNLGMPAMTMVFQVKDAALLDKLNAGDKIRFVVENIGGVTTVTAIEAAN